MKSFVATLATVATLFASLAVAVPQVNGAPVEHPPTTNWKCGDRLYTPNDINVAQQFSVNAKNGNRYYGKKSSIYPNGRFPHQFDNNSGAHKLDYAAYCDDTANRYTFPIIQPGQATPYSGGLNNNKWGDDRILYIQHAGSSESTFCGVITHTGQPQGQFDYCTPQHA